MSVRRFTGNLFLWFAVLLAGSAGTAAGKAARAVNTEQVLAELAAASFECENRCDHEILDTYPVKTQAGSYQVVVTATQDTGFGGCHACGKTLSFFTFRNEDGHWQEKWRQMAAITRGTWGEFDKSQITVRPVSPVDFAVFLESSFLGQGTSVSKLEIFALDNKKLKRLSSTCTASDNSGYREKGEKEYYEWQARYSLVPGDNARFDLKFELEDMVLGKRTVSLFHFRAGRYQSQNADKRLIDPFGGCTLE